MEILRKTIVTPARTGLGAFEGFFRLSQRIDGGALDGAFEAGCVMRRNQVS